MDDDEDKEGDLGIGAFKIMIEDMFGEMKIIELRKMMMIINTQIIIVIMIILNAMIMFIPLIIITCLLAGSVSENRTPSAPRAGLIDWYDYLNILI